MTLSPAVFEQLVARVSEEVTKSITPLLASGSTQNNPPPRITSPQNVGSVSTSKDRPPTTTPTQNMGVDLIELPLGRNLAESSSNNPQNEESTASASAGTAVDSAINVVNCSLRGEKQQHSVPSQIFQSVGLRLDARIPAKLKSKILYPMNLLILACYLRILLPNPINQ